MNTSISRRPRAAAGFTLTEILVVLFILSLLAGLIITGVTAARRHMAVKNTKVMLNMIAGAITSYESDWGDYPPGDGDITGSESLYAALTSRRFGQAYLQGDKYPPAEDTNGNRRKELVDHWHRPISYLHYRNMRPGDPNSDSYQLESSGPDGKIVTVDDNINNWD